MKGKDKVFVDSNIFLYTLDCHDQERRAKSISFLENLSNDARVFISTQVLNEVFVVAVRKLGIDAVLAKNYVRTLADFNVVQMTPEIIFRAMDCSILNQLSYWDALMISSAHSAKCTKFWTEDLSSGSTLLGVKVESPLS